MDKSTTILAGVGIFSYKSLANDWRIKPVPSVIYKFLIGVFTEGQDVIVLWRLVAQYDLRHRTVIGYAVFKVAYIYNSIFVLIDCTKVVTGNGMLL